MSLLLFRKIAKNSPPDPGQRVFTFNGATVSLSPPTIASPFIANPHRILTYQITVRAPFAVVFAGLIKDIAGYLLRRGDIDKDTGGIKRSDCGEGGDPWKRPDV